MWERPPSAVRRAQLDETLKAKAESNHKAVKRKPNHDNGNDNDNDSLDPNP